MHRRLVALSLLAAAPSGVRGQEPAASVVITRGTPQAIANLLRDNLAPQKFRLASAGKSRIVLSQSRGATAQATGEIVRVRLDIGFRLQETAEGIRVTVADETLVADQNGFEQRRTQDLARNRQSYQTLLDRVKATLDGASPPADSAQH